MNQLLYSTFQQPRQLPFSLSSGSLSLPLNDVGTVSSTPQVAPLDVYKPTVTFEGPLALSPATHRLLITRKIAQAFLKQKFPLSDVGKKLFRQVQEAIADPDPNAILDLRAKLPTVEHPHLELFAELDLTVEAKNSPLGADLANIQITKGCSKGCHFCSVSADSHVEMMPFAAILRLAEQKNQMEAHWQILFDDFFAQEMREIGINLSQKRSFRELVRGYGGIIRVKDLLPPATYQRLVTLYKSHPLHQIFPFNETKDFSERHFKRLPIFYDSDASDYRDIHFLHEDGSPANLADVVQALSTLMRPIQITTAGWLISDQKVGQLAARRIVDFSRKNPERAPSLRVSVNPTIKRARQSLELYLRDMKNVFSEWAPLKPEPLLFFDETGEHEGFIETVINPLKKYLESLGYGPRNRGLITYFSGPMAQAARRETDHDAAACMPGVHIWPDGSIHIQQRDDSQLFNAPKGSRPLPTGQRIYRLNDPRRNRLPLL